MVGVALLGAGIYAKEAHIPALIENKGTLLAVYSRSTKSANSVVDEVSKLGGQTSGIDVYSDEEASRGLDELLQRTDIDAVIVVLPIPTQPDVVLKCLAAGKHVLCEKPIAKDVATGRALVQEYEKTYAPKNLVLAVAEQFRYDRAYIRARDIIASGEIGNLEHVHARVWSDLQPGSKYYETAWRKVPEYQGGFILDGGVHFVALMRLVSGQEIIETKSLAIQLKPHLPPVDTVNAALRFSGGATGSLSFSWASKKSAFEFIFAGSKGSITMRMGAIWGTSIMEIESEGKERTESIEGKAMFEEIKAFLAATASGKVEKAGSSQEALADLAVIESVLSGSGIVQS
ncbi:hypothetical protein AJ80_07846 [Polytolypa hystricis UAMH7299]|uniref:Gfo/Idh/MocA-like oxidoreductase N-terminal domain-containing protein n=1 Tax=Polytolypa hystricis (strain UAMH7299) TaxID=1447883 RepID=A0A2B7XHC3_POLH7|nr:hypothetical protein AJ80_07846 [Polytolypa hystricis UAMH7299]